MQSRRVGALHPGLPRGSLGSGRPAQWRLWPVAAPGRLARRQPGGPYQWPLPTCFEWGRPRPPAGVDGPRRPCSFLDARARMSHAGGWWPPRALGRGHACPARVRPWTCPWALHGKGDVRAGAPPSALSQRRCSMVREAGGAVTGSWGDRKGDYAHLSGHCRHSHLGQALFLHGHGLEPTMVRGRAEADCGRLQAPSTKSST